MMVQKFILVDVLNSFFVGEEEASSSYRIPTHGKLCSPCAERDESA